MASSFASPAEFSSKVASNKAIDSEALRSVHDELCDVLGVCEETMLHLTIVLYSKNVIDRKEKRAVLEKSGSKGADHLLDLVGMKVEMGYKRLDVVLTLLDGMENLKHFVDKIKDKQRKLLKEESMETGSHSSDSEMPDDIDDVGIVLSKARKLVEEFDDLVVLVETKLSTVDTGQLIVRLDLFISREESDKCVRKLFSKLNSFSTPRQVLSHLILEKCIGYLNYELLKIFCKSIGDDSEVESKFSHYEASVKVFLRQTSLSTIADLFQQHPEFAPRSLVGLPKFKVTLNTSWEGKSVYQWKELLDKRFNWPRHAHITIITVGSIVIEYSVLPFFALAAVRDLTDPATLAVLKRQGVTVKLTEELIDMAHAKKETHPLLLLMNLDHLVEGSADAVEKLLCTGADPEIEDEHGVTPIVLAGRRLQKSTKWIKMEMEGELGDQRMDGIWDMITETEEVMKIFLLLMQYGALGNENGEPSLLRLMNLDYFVEGSADVVENLLQHDCDPNVEDEHGRTPLLLAGKRLQASTRWIKKTMEEELGDQRMDGILVMITETEEVMKIFLLLMEYGAKQEEPEESLLLLMNLEYFVEGSADAIEKLLQQGADPITKDEFDRPLLMLGVERIQDSSRRILDGMEDLDGLWERIANAKEALKIFCLLIEHGAMRGETEESLLMLLMQLDHFAEGSANAVEKLLQYGANPSVKDKSDRTLLVLVGNRLQESAMMVKNGMIDGGGGLWEMVMNTKEVTRIFSLLLMYGAKEDKTGESSLLLLMKLGHFVEGSAAVVEMLLKQGCDPNLKDEHGRSLLVLAEQRLEESKKWLEKGMEEEEVGLWEMAINAKEVSDIYYLLMQYGAKKDETNIPQLPPVDVATERIYSKLFTKDEQQ